MGKSFFFIYVIRTKAKHVSKLGRKIEIAIKLRSVPKWKCDLRNHRIPFSVRGITLGGAIFWH